MNEHNSFLIYLAISIIILISAAVFIKFLRKKEIQNFWVTAKKYEGKIVGYRKVITISPSNKNDETRLYPIYSFNVDNKKVSRDSTEPAHSTDIPWEHQTTYNTIMNLPKGNNNFYSTEESSIHHLEETSFIPVIVYADNERMIYKHQFISTK